MNLDDTILIHWLSYLLCVAAVSGASWRTCPNSWVVFEESCYYFHFDAMHFTEAETYCRQHHDSHLVHVNDEIENSFIKDRLRHFKGDNWWLGMTDEEIEGVFKWFDTDTEVEYFDWHPGQPDVPGTADCAVYHSPFGFEWGDIACTATNIFTICEIPVGETESVIGR